MIDAVLAVPPFFLLWKTLATPFHWLDRTCRTEADWSRRCFPPLYSYQSDSAVSFGWHLQDARLPYRRRDGVFGDVFSYGSFNLTQGLFRKFSDQAQTAPSLVLSHIQSLQSVGEIAGAPWACLRCSMNRLESAHLPCPHAHFTRPLFGVMSQSLFGDNDCCSIEMHLNVQGNVLERARVQCHCASSSPQSPALYKRDALRFLGGADPRRATLTQDGPQKPKPTTARWQSCRPQ